MLRTKLIGGTMNVHQVFKGDNGPPIKFRLVRVVLKCLSPEPARSKGSQLVWADWVS